MPRAAKKLEELPREIPKLKRKRKIGELVKYEELAYAEWNNLDVYAALPDAIVDGQAIDWKFDPGIEFNAPVNAPLEMPEVKPLKGMDNRARAEKCFSKPLSHPSRWVIATDKQYKEYPDEICHAALKALPEDVTLFASNFDVHPGMEEVGEAYWQFMIGPRSPWRSLYESGTPEKLYFPDGRQSGYILNNIDIVDEKKTTLVYNHCIAMRMIHEYPKTIQSWFDVQKFGLDEIEALYFARMFQILEKHPGYVALNGRNDGCHWPLWFFGAEYSWGANAQKSRYINFDRLYEGRPNFEGKSCQQWTEKGLGGQKGLRGKFSDFDTKTKLEVITQGTFSKVQGYPLEKLIPEFKEWITKYREDVRKALGEVKDEPEPEVQPEIEDEYDEEAEYPEDDEGDEDE